MCISGGVNDESKGDQQPFYIFGPFQRSKSLLSITSLHVFPPKVQDAGGPYNCFWKVHMVHALGIRSFGYYPAIVGCIMLHFRDAEC